MMTMLRLGAVTLALSLAGPTWADPDKDESGKGRNGDTKYEGKYEGRHGESDSRRGGQHRGGSYFHDHGYTRLDIPDGHLPPPGECRIWYPGRPAGQQPPPQPCDAVRRHVPAGAWLLTRSAPEHFDVVVYDQRRPGVVIEVGLFDANTGSFLRVLGTSR